MMAVVFARGLMSVRDGRDPGEVQPGKLGMYVLLYTRCGSARWESGRRERGQSGVSIEHAPSLGLVCLVC